MVIITGMGHANITATHATTLAFTRDKEVSERGDCFVAVACSWAGEIPTGKVTITLECNNKKDSLFAVANPNCDLSSSDLVIRKSDHVDSRTLAVGASKAAADLNRELVLELAKGLPVKVSLFPKV